MKPTFEVCFEVDASSIDTNHPIRDGHFKGECFLDINRYPKMIFKGKLIKTLTRYNLIGELTLHGTTKSLNSKQKPLDQEKAEMAISGANLKLKGKSTGKILGSVLIYSLKP